MNLPCTGGRRAALTDLAIALGFGVAVTAISRHIPPDPGQRTLDVAGYGSIAVASAGLALRRHRPVLTVVIAVAAAVIYLAREYPGGPIYFSLFVAVFTLTAALGRTKGLIAAGGATLSLLVAAELTDRDYGFAQLLVVGWALAAVFIGDAARIRNERAAAARQRAIDHERSQAEETRRLIAEDRLRIARELHDSVAHAMTIINVQAGAAAHVMAKHPERVHGALQAIQHASSEVLDQMNALLRVVRVDDEHDTVARSPAPDLADLASLVERVGTAGLQVQLEVEGAVERVPRVVSAAAYRIVQESLTNVLRHAGTLRAVVRVAAPTAHQLSVTVTDHGNGRGSSRVDHTTAGARLGIIGMRERAAATGGTLRAEPRDGGGFVVHASWGLA